MYLIITVLCVAFAPGCLSYEEIHKYMSSEEVQQFFETNADSVPEYEVVQLHITERLHRRDLSSGRHIHTVAFGKDINLWLHPADSILAGRKTPVYYAKRSFSNPQGVEYRRQHGLMDVLGDIYENPDKMASMVIGTENSGRTRVNGFIESEKIAIKSLPQPVIDNWCRRRRSIDGLENPEQSPDHVVIRMNTTFEGKYSHSPVNETSHRKRLARSVERVPDTLYPEILVVLDNSAYAAFNTPNGNDIYRLLEYVLALWNGVDLKYRSLHTPKIRMHIAAIILGEDVGATPYIEQHMFDSESFIPERAMASARNFWYGVNDTFPFDSYDIVTTMTKYNLGMNRNILGQGYPRSACARDDREKTIEAIAIFRDDSVYSGLYIVAHELGHIFGADHDPEDEHCSYRYGFLMAPTPKFGANSSDFSPCSLKSINAALKNKHLTCLYNRPDQDGESLPKILPGRVMDLKAQCKSLTGGLPCQHKHPEHSVCEDIFCFDDDGECQRLHASAIDGTRCEGKNKFCLHQRCVSL